MKRFTQITLIVGLALTLFSSSLAQDQTQDKTQTRTRSQIHLQDPTGAVTMTQNMFQKRIQSRTMFQDLNGDGINDFVRGGVMNRGNGAKGGYCPGDGTGNMGVRPQNVTGFDAGNGTGIGTCDGTDPKGSAKRGGRK